MTVRPTASVSVPLEIGSAFGGLFGGKEEGEGEGEVKPDTAPDGVRSPLVLPSLVSFSLVLSALVLCFLSV